MPKRATLSFPFLCEQFCLPKPVAEYVFAPPRRWRFDWCWPEYGLALEQQGGIFTQGRHSRGAAMLKEFEKLNAAAAKGFRVLYATPEQIATGAVIPDVEAALRASMRRSA